MQRSLLPRNLPPTSLTIFPDFSPLQCPFSRGIIGWTASAPRKERSMNKILTFSPASVTSMEVHLAWASLELLGLTHELLHIGAAAKSAEIIPCHREFLLKIELIPDYNGSPDCRIRWYRVPAAHFPRCSRRWSARVPSPPAGQYPPASRGRTGQYRRTR